MSGMSLCIDTAEPAYASLPVLAEAISRSLQEVAAQLASLADSTASPVDAAPLVDLVRYLSEVHGALLMIDEQGLAALTQLLRAQLINCGREQGLTTAEAAHLARSFHSMMDRALDSLLGGQRPRAGDLLPCWEPLADSSRSLAATECHPAALVSLRRLDTPVLIPPHESDLELRIDFEPALLSFLRAQDAVQRSDAARRIAELIAQACASVSDTDERVLWLALRAYLIEFAQAGGDIVRANRIVATSARAMRFLGQSGPALAPLAREALFELAQRERSTDEARDIARLFQLDDQFASHDSFRQMWIVPDPLEGQFADLVDAAITSIDIDPAKLSDSAGWLALSQAAAHGVRTAPLAEPLRLVGLRLSEGSAEDPEWLAAALLCLHDCVNQQVSGYDGVAKLADALLAIEPAQRWRRMQDVAQSVGAHRLWREWSSTLGAAMTAVEQSLDAGDSNGTAHASAVETLTQISGALQLLGLDAERDAVMTVRALFEAEPAHVIAPDEALAQQWVQLQQSFALLPWRITELYPEPEDTSHNDISSSRIDSNADSLSTVFIREAGGLLDEMRTHLRSPDVGALMQVAHTLAGCSATVGATAIAALAHALEHALARGARWDPWLLNETLTAFEEMLATFVAHQPCNMASALVERWRILEGVGTEEKQSSDVPEGLSGTSLNQVSEPINEAAQAHLPDAVTGSDADGAASWIAVASTETASVTVKPVPVDTQTTESSLPDDGAADPQQTSSDNDAELFAIFREEASDLLPQIEQSVRAWQRQPDDREPPAALLRALHTLKGSARMAGQPQLGEDFHRTEADINALSRLAPAAVAARLPALLERVDGWLQSLSVPPGSSVEPTPTFGDEAVTMPVPSSPAAPSLLRVRADRLAQVADSGVEVWLGNARVRELLQEQRRSVTDLSEDLARLRAQLRELEIEADSRILSRATQESSADFDPLELDRYTRLHELTRMMAESLTDIVNMQRGMGRQLESLGTAASAQARDIHRQQAELQALRSQPLQTLEARLTHLLRQASREAGRDATLVVDGGEVEIERSLMDRLMGPLGHLLRNAVVHGIEPPDERERIGKPRTGTVSIAAALSGHELRLTLGDDGRGLDMERIRTRAQAIGLLREHESPDTQALALLIFEPGFSTASEVTALSGRGIGLDAVRVELQALGGRIEMDTEAGKGCRFSIRLPASLASVQVLLATAGRWRIALPASQLQQVLQLDSAQIKQNNDRRQIVWQSETIRLLHLGTVLGDGPVSSDDPRVPVAVLRDGKNRLAVQLDAIEGQRDVIIKHPGAQLSQVPGLTGATLLGDGGIALIIDPFRLPEVEPVSQSAESASMAPVVLVVDDSLTVRRASQRLLERHGYTVALARDGIEALERLQQHCPAAVLLDIEMPRMDGFELLSALRDDVRFRALPVVMITSRIAERHRERATLLGATAYLGKPYDEVTLLGLLAQLCATPAAVA
jgi:chemotaxis protein histidine kinase CheA/ActR/RegA family two-component response regulator